MEREFYLPENSQNMKEPPQSQLQQNVIEHNAWIGGGGGGNNESVYVRGKVATESGSL